MAPDLQVAQQDDQFEYGILIYDVPTANQSLYHRLQTRIRRRAIRLNLSVYLFIWSYKESLEKIVEEAKKEVPGQSAVVFVAKFDNESREELRRQAKESLIRDVRGLGTRVLKAVEKAQKKAAEESKIFTRLESTYTDNIKKRLEEAKALAMLFGLTHDVEHAFEATQKILASEMTHIQAEAQARMAEVKAEDSTKRAREALGIMSPKNAWTDRV
jgi:CRISPR-associated endonuclease Cas2